MNYPGNTIMQTYNVNAGRVIQLPCFMDQPEPPDGFRAVIFSQPVIDVGAIPPNQTGPAFAAGQPAAIQFDLTQLIQQNALSRARCIAVQTEVDVNTGAAPGTTGANFAGIDVLFDSGLMLPCAPDASIHSEAFSCGDFISANPIFAILASDTWMNLPTPAAAFTVCVANFKLDFNGFNLGGFQVGV